MKRPRRIATILWKLLRSLLWLIVGFGLGLVLWVFMHLVFTPTVSNVTTVMLGHVSSTELILWVRGTTTGLLEVRYWPAFKPGWVLTQTATLSDPEDRIAHLVLNSLEPGTTYRYRVLLNGQDISPKSDFRFRMRPARTKNSTPPKFTVMLGSCAFFPNAHSLLFWRRPKHRIPMEIFDQMANQAPDSMLWLGDNFYLNDADLLRIWDLAYRYRYNRSRPEWQRFLRSTHHYAIWDDHDFGWNNAHNDYPWKDKTLEIFQRYWANPSYGSADAPGIFSRFSTEDADFFLLDGRYYRDRTTLLGQAQLAWLKTGLGQSQALFKVIAMGSQMLNLQTGFEGWANYPTERDEFLAWLKQQQIPGVVFVSGDRHTTELLKREFPDHYPLYELTCSTLTGRVYPDRQPDAIGVPGTLVKEHNFCTMTWQGPQSARDMVLATYNAQGQQLWQYTIPAHELGLTGVR